LRVRQLLSTFFPVAVVLAATLLFLIEPMEAKALLPELGGSAGVWTVSLVFYQTTLLAGYVYAHLLVRRLTLRQSAMVHSGVVAAGAFLLPWHGPAQLAQGHLPPSLWLLATLGVSIGVPFFALAATGPLLQRWSTALGVVRSPYGLYALANGGSLVALLAYPGLLERYVPLTATPSGASGAAVAFAQHVLWSWMYLVFAVLVVLCGWPMARAAGGRAPARSLEPSTSVRQRMVWVGLAAVPSAAMLSTTQVLATDIASVPLLWVVSLAIYLVTFIVAFAAPGRLLRRVAAWATTALSLGIAASQWVAPRPDPEWALPLYLAALLSIGILCHRRLAERRPPAGSVTDFYLWIAAGSAAGSLACGLVAPLVFRSVAEYPLTLVLACLVGAATEERRGARSNRLQSTARDVAWPAAVALSYSAIAIRNWRASDDRLEARTFFGVLRVRDAWGPPFIPQGGPHRGQQVRLPLRELYHGTTLHGAQVMTHSQARLPTTYYHPSGPIGGVFSALRADPERAAWLAHVGVIGLGVGSIAAYAKPGESFVFFEIDPEVIRIARDPTMFSFLKDCEGTTEIVVGDGRLSLAERADGAFGLLIVDAFSSDAVPVHLLTREAVTMALGKVEPEGLVAYHLTSNFFDLAPVLAEVAASLGDEGLSWDDEDLSATDVVTGKQPSLWVVLTRDAAALTPLKETGRWARLASQRRTDGGPWLWTDNYSSPLAALHAPRTITIRVAGQ
jgi:hypothetical protein